MSRAAKSQSNLNMCSEYLKVILGCFVDIGKCCSPYLSKHANYICDLEDNLESLEKMKKEVDERLDAGTKDHVTQVLEQGDRELKDRCMSCCPKMNCCASYKLGKEVAKLIEEVKASIAENAVAVKEEPQDEVVGADIEANLNKALGMINDDANVSVVGIHGMGGVGKTTLLNKINNHFIGGNNEWQVIYVVVPKKLDLVTIQKHIGTRLGIIWIGNELKDGRHNLFEKLKKTKFLLLLDNCWEFVDLEAIGVPPPPQRRKGGKIIFTTRVMGVCGRMGAPDTTITVGCFDRDGEEAWQLFQKHVGEETLKSHPQIPQLARDVARKCCGLPLALEVMGKSMSTKRTVQQWKNYLDVMQNLAPDISDPTLREDVEKKIFKVLNVSFQNLHQNLQKFFLYCALYPENFNIDKIELIMHWIGEGFLDEYQIADKASGAGIAVIEELKAVGLLESGIQRDVHVKMHDVIRDLAIWISHDYGENVDKVLVRSGNDISDATLTSRLSAQVERVSLIKTSNITSLKDPAENCIRLSTLLLQYNSQLCDISDTFFQFTPALKVLNLSRTGITKLPTSISSLVRLEYMDLSFSGLQELPLEFRELVRLKFLDLFQTNGLKTIPQGVISSLLELRILDLRGIGFQNWNVEEPVGNNVEAGGTEGRLTELKQLKQLTVLALTISSTVALQKLLKLENNNIQVSITKPVIKTCHDLVSLEVSKLSTTIATTTPAMPNSSSSLRGMEKLRTLEIGHCESLRELTITWTPCGLQHLERLRLYWLTKFTNLNIKCQPESITAKLQFVEIVSCNSLEDLTWCIYLPKIIGIGVFHCSKLKQIINDGVADVQPFSSLQKLQLSGLPKLESIHEHSLPFPCLEMIAVRSCPLLRRLPFNNDSARNKLQSIRGSLEWWENLQWENGDIRTSFHKYFNETIIR